MWAKNNILKNIKWRLANRVSDQSHVFILGSPRSGTTLLQVIISIHSDFYACESETGIFTWQDLFDEKRRYCGLSVEMINKIMGECKNSVEFMDKLAIYFLNTNSASRFVEKTPQHVLHLRKLLKYFPNSQFINLYRDGRDCYCSSKFHKNVPQRKNVKVFAKYWKKCVNARIQEGNNKKIFDVKYEELTSNPKDILEKIMRYLGASMQYQQLSNTKIAEDKRSGFTEHQNLKNPINTSSQGRWRNEMTMHEKELFWRIAGKELERIGYEKD